MNETRAKNLQKRMPYKHVFFDTANRCYRLIDPCNLYSYRDEEGREHKRQNACTLIPMTTTSNML